jgi:hypothetical protein
MGIKLVKVFGRMEAEPALNVYSETKSEYMFQLTSYLTPAYFNFYSQLLERAKQDMTAEPKKQLWQFQNLLAEIEDWNMERVAREVAAIQTAADCDFLEDLLTAVFIAHTKVLTAIRLNAKQKKVQITVPKIDHFLLKVFCETAKLLWQSAYLFRDNIGGIEKQQNYKQIQSLIETGIRSAIRSMIPVKSLLKDCIHNTADEDDSSDSEDETPVAAAEVAAPVKEVVAPVEEVAAPTEEVHPVVRALMEPEPKNEIVAEQNQSTLIVVDDSPQVSFNDFEQIFDSENDDGNIMQPTQFHEGKGYDEEDDEPGLTILDDVGTPLAAEDLDQATDETLGPIEFDELK